MLLALFTSISLAGPHRVVAERDLPAGTTLAVADLRRIRTPLTPPEDALGALEQAVGRTTLEPIPTGALVREAWLAGPDVGAVVHVSEVPARVAPHGRARIAPVLGGRHAFVGRIELDGGVALPAHRDPTEEFIWMLEGTGTLTLDGVTHELEPGHGVYMPAQAEVSFQAGPGPVSALQVFAGPEPAEKYGGWDLEERAGDAHTAWVGPFRVTCARSHCAVAHGSVELVSELEHHGAPEQLIAPLGPLGDGAALLQFSEGDGCPIRYRALCGAGGAPELSEAFGNCSEPDAIRRTERGLELSFPALPEANRAAVRAELIECELQ